jgi:hypothetical protein
MLNQLTQTKLSQFILNAGVCLLTLAVTQIDFNTTKTAETGSDTILIGGLMPNGTNINGTSLNGTSFNGASLNGANLNGVVLNGIFINGSNPEVTKTHKPGLKVTSPAVTTAVLKQKPIQQIRLEGSQIALKIKRSDV